MNRTEKALWKRTRRCFPGIVERMENYANPGYPDVQGHCIGRCYWVELKVTTEKKARCMESVTNLLRPSQKVWLIQHMQHGAISFILVGFKKGILLYKVAPYTSWASIKQIKIFKMLEINSTLSPKKVLYFKDTLRKEIVRAF